MWKVRSHYVKSLIVRVDADALTEEQVDELAKLFESNKGSCKLYFDLISRDSTQAARLLSRTAVVDPTTEVMQGLTRLFGLHAVVVEGDG